MKLSVAIDFDVRFSETDAMGVIWHGNYLKYFEDGREAFGKKYGLEYLDIYEQGYYTPIVKSNINHKSPIYYGQRAQIITTMIPSKAAKIIFEYEIINLSTKKISATGSTMQIFMLKSLGEMDLNIPDFYLRWKSKVGIEK